MELTEEEKKRLEDFFKKRDSDFDAVNTECYNPEEYFSNIGGEHLTKETANDLNKENIESLLKWKSARFFSKNSENVKKVLGKDDDENIEKIKKINSFRKGESDEFEPIFKSGVVYNVFIKHIAQPWEYPIYDYHVRDAFLRLKLGDSQDLYNKYKEFFFALYEAVFGKEPKTLEYSIYYIRVLNAFLRELGYSQDLYNEYKKFFFALYEAVFGKEPKTVERMKEVDSALFNYDKEKEKQEKEKQKNPNQGG